MARQTLGGEPPVVGQDGASGASDGFARSGPGSDGSSSSCSRIGVSRRYAEGNDSSSDIDSTDFDMTASDARAEPMQSAKELIDLDSAERETTAPDGRSPGRETLPADEGTAGLLLGASSSSSPRTPDHDKTRKSLERAKGKRYGRWPAWLLRYACSMRGIVRMTRMKDVDLLVASLGR